MALIENYNEVLEGIKLMSKEQLLACYPDSSNYSSFKLKAMRNMVALQFSSHTEFNQYATQSKAGHLMLEGTIGLGQVALSMQFKAIGVLTYTLSVAGVAYDYVTEY